MIPNSQRAIENLQKICEECLHERVELEIIDIYQHPIFASIHWSRNASLPAWIHWLPVVNKADTGRVGFAQEGLGFIKWQPTTDHGKNF